MKENQNKRNETISIIIPVFKVEKYLYRCVNSIINQTYPYLEIILVDDGSPDNCPKICELLREKDSRIKVLHKKNGGLSSARNAGLNIASGDYIGFVDSDDYVDNEMFENLLTNIKEYNADISICGIIPEYDTNKENKLKADSFRPEILSREDMYNRIQDWRYVTVWNKLYKSYLWNELRFPEGKIHEDEFVIHHLIEKCNRVAVIGDNYYHYTIRSSSITGDKLSEKHFNVVEAFLDRYFFFMKKGEKNIAYQALRMAYGKSIDYLSCIENINDKKYVKSLLNCIQFELFKWKNLRFLKMTLYRLRYHI